MNSLSYKTYKNNGQDVMVIYPAHYYNKLKLGNMTLDCSACSLSTPYGGLRLAKREFRILETLMSNPCSRITVEMLCENVRQFDEQVEEGTIWSDLFYLRQKLILIHTDYQIQNDHCEGYRMEKTN